MSRHLVRLPASVASDPRKLIEICPGCAEKLHSAGGILETDRLDQLTLEHDRSVVVYNPTDPELLDKLRAIAGVHHVFGGH